MPIIFITACAAMLTSVEAMKVVPSQFLTKPVREKALLAAISQALDRSRRTLEHEAGLAALRRRYVSLTTREREVYGARRRRVSSTSKSAASSASARSP